MYPRLGWNEVEPYACEMWLAYESCTGLQWTDVEEAVRQSWQAAELPVARYAGKLPHD